MDTHDDIALFKRLKNNDQTALRELFDRHFAELCMVAFRLTKDRDLSQDIAQTVYISLWNKRQSIDIDSAVFPYLRTMAIRQAIAVVRTNTRRAGLLADGYDRPVFQADGEEEFIRKELRVEVERAVEELPPRSKIVFKLSRYEQLTQKEIAAALGISVKTVENHMTRALKQLRGALRHYLSIFF